MTERPSQVTMRVGSTYSRLWSILSSGGDSRRPPPVRGEFLARTAFPSSEWQECRLTFERIAHSESAFLRAGARTSQIVPLTSSRRPPRRRQRRRRRPLMPTQTSRPVGRLCRQSAPGCRRRKRPRRSGWHRAIDAADDRATCNGASVSVGRGLPDLWMGAIVAAAL